MNRLSCLVSFITTFTVFLKFSISIAVNDGSSCLKDNEFDYIIVGSGSTGGVLASRLSETPDVRVLLLEAGGEPKPETEIPFMLYKGFFTDMDWNLTSVPQKHCCHIYPNSILSINRGKTLGGTSSINFMTYTRCFREDYNHWAELGNEGWSWDDVFPYLLKLEDYRAEIPNPEDVPYHHQGGPLTIEFPSYRTPFAQTFLDAGVELGYSLIDYNARNQIGFMYPPVNIRNGTRCGTYQCYIKPSMQRPNFIVETQAYVTKIFINQDKVATGVRYDKGDDVCTAKAKREVIVSAGVFGSPRLLLLSGIGPKSHLKNVGIEPVVHSPGVGRNFHDHVALGGINYYVNDTVTLQRQRFENEEYLNEWQRSRTGPMTSPIGIEGLAFIATENANSTTWPDIEIYFIADSILKIMNPYLRKMSETYKHYDADNQITFLPILLRPKSRGIIKLKSNNPYDQPIIDPRLLSSPIDRDTIFKGTAFIDKIIETAAFKRYAPQQIYGYLYHAGSLVSGRDNYMKPSIPLISTSGYHPAGSCKMGPDSDKMAVVDNQLKVRGVHGLRVADASIMPEVVAGHPNVACIMIGEKVADMIKKEWGDPVIPFDAPDPLRWN